MNQAEGIVPLDDVQVIFPVQYRKTERTLNFLSHVTQAAEVEGVCLLDELDGNVAVCLDVRIREFQGLAKQTVIIKSPVVGQRKGHPLGVAREGMIILKL